VFYLLDYLISADRSRSMEDAIGFLEVALTFLKQEQRDMDGGQGVCS
jgi:hypothetical protein